MMIEKMVLRSMEEHTPLLIIYEKRNEITQRMISPKAVDNGIVKAWDYDKHEIRSYNLAKILAVQVPFGIISKNK